MIQSIEYNVEFKEKFNTLQEPAFISYIFLIMQQYGIGVTIPRNTYIIHLISFGSADLSHNGVTGPLHAFVILIIASSNYDVWSDNPNFL